MTVVDPADPGDPADPADPANSESSSHNSDGLPFSGLDVALLAAMGVSLLALGLGMRRMTRRPDTA